MASLKLTLSHVTFLHAGIFSYMVPVIQKSQYKEKQVAGRSLEKTMLSLLWDLEELNRLNKEAKALTTTISVAFDVLAMPEASRTEHNLLKQLGHNYMYKGI